METVKAIFLSFVALVLITASSDKSIADELVVTETGNVGIGTNAPGYKAEINGGWLRVCGTGHTNGDPATRIGVYDTDNTGGITGWWFSQNSDGKLAIHQDSIGDRLVIDGSGNVGIGTESPQAKFSVSLNNGDMFNIYSPTDNALAIQTTLDSQPIGTYGGDNQNRLALQPVVGKVGIGLSDPQYKLDVQGTARISDGSLTFNLGARSDSVMDVVYDTTDRRGLTIHSTNASNSINLIEAWTLNGNWTQRFAVATNGVVYSNGIALSSDLRLKENIEPFQNALDLVEHLRGVSFDWVDPSRGEGRQVGVIAQEVEQVLPEVVHRDSKGYMSVEYSKLVAPLIEAIKELSEQNKKLQAQNANLKNEMADLRSEVEQKILAIEAEMASR